MLAEVAGFAALRTHTNAEEIPPPRSSSSCADNINGILDEPLEGEMDYAVERRSESEDLAAMVEEGDVMLGFPLKINECPWMIPDAITGSPAASLDIKLLPLPTFNMDGVYIGELCVKGRSGE